MHNIFCSMEIQLCLAEWTGMMAHTRVYQDSGDGKTSGKSVSETAALLRANLPAKDHLWHMFTRLRKYLGTRWFPLLGADNSSTGRHSVTNCYLFIISLASLSRTSSTSTESKQWSIVLKMANNRAWCWHTAEQSNFLVKIVSTKPYGAETWVTHLLSCKVLTAE